MLSFIALDEDSWATAPLDKEPKKRPPAEDRPPAEQKAPPRRTRLLFFPSARLGLSIHFWPKANKFNSYMSYELHKSGSFH